MGWKLTVFAVIVALVFLAATLWQLSLLIFVVLVIPPLARRFSRRGGKEAGTGSRFPVRQAVGGFLIFLSLVAFVYGGTLSPLLFGGLGLLLLLGWNHIPLFSLGGSLKPVKGSVLLRASFMPFRWTALVEVKPITRDLGRALSGLGEPIVIHASGTPSIHIAVSRSSLSEKSAEESIMKVIERIGRGVVPLGAYLLPLDSGQASALLREPMQSTEFSEEGWALILSTGAYDVLTVGPAKGFARSFGLYRRTQSEDEKARVPGPTLRFNHPPLLWEVFKSLEGRVQWPNPYRYTSFLSSIFATSYEPIGSNIIDAGTSPTSETVTVRSYSSPEVELSRVQLRAIMAIYSQGPPRVVEKQPEPQPQPIVVPEALAAQ